MMNALIGRTLRDLSLSLSLSLSIYLWRHNEKVTICKPGRALSPEPNHTSNLISHFQAQNCEKINFCCLSYPTCGIFLWQPELTSTERQLEKYHIKSNKNSHPFYSQ